MQIGEFWRITPPRERILLSLCGLACTLLVALLVARGIFKDAAGASSYAALAEAFLQGRLDIAAKCPEVDCAVFIGKTYIVFPPLPAVILMPIVALTGAAGFKGGIWIALVMILLALWLWQRLLAMLNVPGSAQLWLLTAIAFASPVYFITFMAPGVWFLAQACAFLLCTLALYAILAWRSLPLAGLFIALALHSRHLSIFYPLFLFALLLAKDEKLFWPHWTTIRAAIIAAIPIAISVAIMLAYNYARFGNAFDTGYSHIVNPDIDNVITRRFGDIGLFSIKYFLYNAYYLLFQGFHVSFAGPYQLTPVAIDLSGTAILIASPWLFLLFYARMDRLAVFGLLTIAIIAGISLFYYSNGYEQWNTQRYSLDWLPIALVVLARQQDFSVFRALPLLVGFAVLLNLIAIATRIVFV